MRFITSYRVNGETKDVEFKCYYDNRFAVQRCAIKAIKEEGGENAEPISLGRASHYPDTMIEVSRIS
jgi:hypothetical protein